MRKDKIKGILAENIVQEAAEVLQKKFLIEKIIRARKGGEIDGLGIDILIFLKGGLTLPIQVKSSAVAMKKHLYKYSHINNVIVLYGTDELVYSQEHNPDLFEKMKIKFIHEAEGLLRKAIIESTNELRSLLV